MTTRTVDDAMASPDAGRTGIGGMTRSHVSAAIAFSLVTAVSLAVAWSRVAPGLGAAQRAGAAVDYSTGLQAGVLLDAGFALAYVTFGVLVFSLFRRERGMELRAWHPAAAAGAWLVAFGGVADLAENTILTADLQGWLGGATATWNTGKLAAGVVKFALLAAAVMALLVVLATRRRELFRIGDSRDRPMPTNRPTPDWNPPGPGEEPRLGVCLSGGGIRSAAFCLGGVQALQDKGVLENAAYLSAVSGGGYLAAGWAVSDASSPALAPGQPWSRGSPEERWFRDNASYLIPDLLGGLKGVGRLLAGVVVNFLLIWLLLFLIGRPIGWAIGAVHPELKPQGPVALVRDDTGALSIVRVDRIGTADAVVDGATVTANRYAAFLGATPGTANQSCFDTAPFNPGDRQHCSTVEQVPDRPAIIEVRAGKAQVLVQPKVRLAECANPGELRCRVLNDVVVQTEPRIALKRAEVHEPMVVDQLKISTQPTFHSVGGLAARGSPEYRTWMWEASVCLVLAGGLAALVVMGGRLRGRAEGVWRNIALSLALAGVVCLLVTIVLPALAAWIPKFSATLPGTDVALGEAALPSGGIIATLLLTARQYLTGNRKGSGTGPVATERRSPFAKAWTALTGSKEQLSWYELSPLKVAMALLVVVGFVVSFVAQLQYSIPNGPGGRLLGVAFVRDRMPYWAFAPEYVRFLLVGGLLAVFAMTVDAHSWSLFPFYKRQLSRAYILRRLDGRARDIPYSELLPFTKEAGLWGGLRPDAEAGTRPGPKLVLCCAVNISESGVVPPGRRAGSFTFDADYIGGPLVGYTTADDYWDNLPDSRRRDITIPSAMAISGAAFSPAMGKQNLGPVGSVLALANLRLGVWLPHPQAVTPANAERWSGRRRPGWTWFLREVLNSYGFQRRYLYVSDGGHWDNLGLVELLRRGCTEIICISAAGDGTDSFGTLAEAIALAREELGVDIALDPSPLRPPVGDAGPAAGRELRRLPDKTKAQPFAPSPYIVGEYTWTAPAATGTILYIETALTDDLPLDVHGFAESEAIFPDDSTADQVFNHRQFEAFRALGYHQVSSAFPT